MKKLSFISLTLIVLSCEPAPSRDRVDQVLDRLHLYASQANGEAYFDLFADDAVFFGTRKRSESMGWPGSQQEQDGHIL